jgi:MoaA/NifB/PqqE/SkfB family radical SAM enzyme
VSKFTPYLKLIDQEHMIKSIQMNLLNKCTSNCKSCRKPTWPDHILDLNVIRRTLSHLRHYGLESVLFSGGDPILYPDLSDLMEYCKSINLPFSFITTMITGKNDLVIEIAEKATRIHISVDAANPELYSQVRGTGTKAFQLVKHNLGTIDMYRPKDLEKPRLSMTVAAHNCHDVINVYNLAKAFNCNINFYLIHTWDDMAMTIDQITEFECNMIRIARDANDNGIVTNAGCLAGDEEVRRAPDCITSHIHCAIDADGSIFPCCVLLNDNDVYDPTRQYAYGNINNEPVGLEFSLRFMEKYPLDCKLCKECNSRYIGINSEYHEHVTSKGALFL